MSNSLLVRLREAFREVADPNKATGMQAYMKSAMPYWGVPTPVRRRICRETFAQFPLSSAEAWQKTVLEIWSLAERREERYAAIELTGAKAYREFQTMATLPMYERIVVEGAWWDYVDDIASHRLRYLLLANPKEMTSTMLRWSRDTDLWKRRCSIICQLRRGEETDTQLLFACIEANFDDGDFFIRKAIGWALRDLAWFDLETIEAYVEENVDRLSSLSKREALRNAEKVRAKRTS